MLPPEKLDRLTAGQYSFNFGQYISEGFSLVNRGVGLAILFTILLFGINMILGNLGQLGSLIYSILISPAMVIGFFVYCHHIKYRGKPDIQDFFSQFHRWKEILLVGLAQSAVFVVAALVFGLMTGLDWSDPFHINNLGLLELNADEITSTAMWTGVLLTLIGVVISTTLNFALPLVVFHEYSAGEAIPLSFNILKHKAIILVVFFIVTAILMILGVFGLIIAILYTIPAGYAMHYAAFDDIVGSQTEVLEDDITQHMIL